MSLEGSYSLHSEHYVFLQIDNMQLVMETFGNYKHPSLFKIEMLDLNTYKLPDDINPNAAKGIFVPQGVPDESVIRHMEHFVIDMMRQQSEK